MTRLGITNLWGGWNITGGTITNPGIWSYEGVAAAHIVLFGGSLALGLLSIIARHQQKLANRPLLP